MPNILSKFLTKFSAEKYGGVALMGGLTIGLVATSVIAAVDITDMQTTKQKMQNRVDAAVLFATLQDKYREPGTEQELQDVARGYLIDSVRTTGVRAKDIKTDFIYDAARDRIVGKVNFTPPAIFIGSVIAPRGLVVSAEAAPLTPTKMEVALVLDISGSMNWAISSDIDAPVGSRRIDALRDGVETLVTALVETPKLEAKMSVIPYATSVDVGGLIAERGGSATTYFRTLDGSDLPEVCNRTGGNAYGLCGEIDRDDDDDTGGTADSVSDPSPIGAWGAERYVAKVGSNFTLNLAKPLGSGRIPVMTQPNRETYCDDSYVATYGERCVEFVTIDGDFYAEKDYFAPRSGIQPMTDDLDDITSFMGTLQGEGGTAGHIGTAWGLYSLSEDWHDVFDHPAGKPSKFEGETQKVMIVMTDGDFTMTHDENMTVAETYDYFQSVCDLARANGVLIYTVGLRASTLTDQQLTECAASADRYYPADSREQLVKAFEKIAEQAAQVRLSH